MTEEVIGKNRAPTVSLLGREEERDLARRNAAGDPEARERLTRAYDPLIRREVRKWCEGTASSSSAGWWDMYQEAYAALIQAMDRYEPDRGFRLGTYAYWRIANALSQYTHKMRGPVATAKSASERLVFTNFNSMKAEIEEETGQPLDDVGREYMADLLNVKKEVVLRVEQRLSNDDVSLEAPVDDGTMSGDNGFAVGDIIADERDEPEDDVSLREYRETMKNVIHETIRELPETIAYIMQARWLHNQQRGPSLQKIANELNLGREQTRLLELQGKKALATALRRSGLAGPECYQAAAIDVGDTFEMPEDTVDAADDATAEKTAADVTEHDHRSPTEPGADAYTPVLPFPKPDNTDSHHTANTARSDQEIEPFKTWLRGRMNDDKYARKHAGRVQRAAELLGVDVTIVFDRVGDPEEVIRQVEEKATFQKEPKGVRRAICRSVRRYLDFVSMKRLEEPEKVAA